MSHFTVLVVGEDAEEQLQPFHEFECTGEDDQFVQDVDLTDEVRAEYASRGDDYRDHSLVKFVEEWHGLRSTKSPDLGGEHKYGFALVDDSGEIVKVIRRTNPNAKWDWYQLGGRWTGFFKLHAGANGEVGRPGVMTSLARPGFADAAHRGDIDFVGTEAAEVEKQLPAFERALSIINTHGIPPRWEHVRDAAVDINTARALYNSHPAIRVLHEERLMPFSEELLDRFCGFDRAAFVARTRGRSWSPYALLINGQWVGRGEMGWFGLSSGDAPEKEWHARVRETVLALAPDTMLSVFDCHI